MANGNNNRNHFTIDSLNGTWKNELGSTVNLSVDATGIRMQIQFIISFSCLGTISGVYHTAVSSKKKPLTSKRLIGIVQESDFGIVFGMTVLWEYKDKEGKTKRSAVSWVGQGWNADPEKITTLWNLASAVEIDDEWRSFTSNKDVFRKQQQ